MATLIWGMVFSAIGLGYFVYGKRQQHMLALACGLGLMLYPYFIDSAWWMVLIGVALMAPPWYWR